jgi:hypothetical protein
MLFCSEQTPVHAMEGMEQHRSRCAKCVHRASRKHQPNNPLVSIQAVLSNLASLLPFHQKLDPSAGPPDLVLELFDNIFHSV